MRSARVVAAAFVAVVIGVLACAPTSLAAVSSAGSPKPLPHLAPTQGKAVKVPAGSITYALGTSDGSIGDGRPRFTWTLAHGASHMDYGIAYNLGAKPLTLRVYGVDATTDTNGSLTANAAKMPRKGVGLWMKPYTTFVTIPGKSSIVIPFQVTVPKNAAVGDHGGALVVGTIPSVERTPGKEVIRQETRIAMPAYVRVAGTLTTRVAFSSFKVSFKTKAFKPGFGDVTVKYSIVNTGNVRVAVDQKITLRGLLGVTTRSTTPASVQQLLPDTKYTGTVVFKHVPAALTIKATGFATPIPLDPGSPSGKTATISKTVAAVSWTAVALVTTGVTIVVLIVLIVLQLLGIGGAASRKIKKGSPAEAEKVSVGSTTSGE